MKKGLILLEVLMATAIASIISGSLVSSLYQAYRFQATVDKLATLSMRIAVLHRQLERDLSGAFIPVQAEVQEDQKKEEDKKETSKQDKTKQSDKAADKKEKKKPLEKVFYSVNSKKGKEKRLELLTCITNNPLQIFWSARSGRAKPKVARVVYRIVSDKKQANSYILMRQEGPVLAFDAYGPDAEKKIRSYPVLEGIKSVTVKYTVVIEKKEEKVTRDTKQFDQWGVKQPQKDDKQKLPLIPQHVELHVTLWDTQFKQATPTVITVPIVAQIDALRIPEEKPEDKKEDKDKKKKQPEKPDQIQQRFKKSLQDIKRLVSLSK